MKLSGNTSRGQGVNCAPLPWPLGGLMERAQLNVRVPEDFKIELKKMALDSRLSFEKFVFHVVKLGLERLEKKEKRV